MRIRLVNRRFVICLLSVCNQFEITPAAKPIIIADGTLTKPAAGVMATSPTTAPMAMPAADGFAFNYPVCKHPAYRGSAAAAEFVVTRC
jgi:hypothetical protein